MTQQHIYDLVQPISIDNILFAFKWILFYFGYMFLCSKFLPGKTYQGFKTTEGKILSYKLTGFMVFLQTPVLILLSKHFQGFTLRPLITHFWSFFIAATIFSFIISILLLVTGRKSKEYAPHKTEGSQLLMDFWMGATANPRFLEVDLKMFFYQPSLIGLHIFMMAFAEYQYDTYGRLTTNMILLQIFEYAYFFVHYMKEDFMLSTWDFLAENFGFMLVWGDTAYLPFLYGLPGWFIADKEETLKGLNLVLLVILHVVSHYIFRAANFQKYDFKRNGMKAQIWGAPPKTIDGKLLVSGWWGIGRHLNYTGEIVTYLTFSLCCGTTSLIPYLLPISVLSLLVQRAGRDDRKCSEKYGENWKKYCQQAKFAVIPYIY